MKAHLSIEVIASVHRWLHVWNIPELAAQATIEWSPRLTRSLGRCYPERRLIRLAAAMNDAPRPLLEELLCRELAHLAAREVHGRRLRPHGPELEALMHQAGFEKKPKLPAPTNTRAKLHRNDRCSARRTAFHHR
jgi:predicted SprT family Zn-dependent metalloprotease